MCMWLYHGAGVNRSDGLIRSGSKSKGGGTGGLGAIAPPILALGSSDN